MSAIKARRSAYKVTDFRRELQYREKKVAEIKREQMKIFADIRPVPRYVITIDLSHARGNMDALKQGLQELGWKEVSHNFLELVHFLITITFCKLVH